MDMEIKQLVSDDARKTSMVTSRSSSGEPYLVTPSAVKAKAMTMGMRTSVTQRSASIDLNRLGSYTVSSEETSIEEEDGGLKE